MFSLFIRFKLPVMKRAVPLAKFKANLDFEGFGSNIYSSITN